MREQCMCIMELPAGHFSAYGIGLEQPHFLYEPESQVCLSHEPHCSSTESKYRLFSLRAAKDCENDLWPQFYCLSVEYVTSINICNTSFNCFKVKALSLFWRLNWFNKVCIVIAGLHKHSHGRVLAFRPTFIRGNTGVIPETSCSSPGAGTQRTHAPHVSNRHAQDAADQQHRHHGLHMHPVGPRHYANHCNTAPPSTICPKGILSS